MPFLFLEFTWLNTGAVAGQMLLVTCLATEANAREDLAGNLFNFLTFTFSFGVDDWSTLKLSSTSHVPNFVWTVNVCFGKPWYIALRYINKIKEIDFNQLTVWMNVTCVIITIQTMKWIKIHVYVDIKAKIFVVFQFCTLQVKMLVNRASCSQNYKILMNFHVK